MTHPYLCTQNLQVKIRPYYSEHMPVWTEKRLNCRVCYKISQKEVKSNMHILTRRGRVCKKKCNSYLWHKGIPTAIFYVNPTKLHITSWRTTCRLCICITVDNHLATRLLMQLLFSVLRITALLNVQKLQYVL